MTDATNMTADWIQRNWAKMPCTLLPDGNIRTGPVRLSFPHLFKAQAPMEPGGKEKYSATFLFPIGVDLSLLKDAAGDTAKERWPNALDLIKSGQLHSPFRDQKDKLQFEGYVAGATFLTCTGERKPLVTDTRGAPIVEERLIYPGAWVLGIIRPFAFDAKMKKGISFGLQGVIKIADDKELGGGGVDIGAAVAGIEIDAADVPDQMFGKSDSDEAKLFA